MSEFLFLSTLSLRRATKTQPGKSHKLTISIHALLAESDCEQIINAAMPLIFLSTLSLRRATDQGASTQTALQISIHALLAESDHVRCFSPAGCWRISIHALLAESDRPPRVATLLEVLFLSTLSLRRAT